MYPASPERSSLPETSLPIRLPNPLSLYVARRTMGWTQAVLAEKAGLDVRTVGPPERVDSPVFTSWGTLHALARLYDVPRAFFFLMGVDLRAVPPRRRRPDQVVLQDLDDQIEDLRLRLARFHHRRQKVVGVVTGVLTDSPQKAARIAQWAEDRAFLDQVVEACRYRTPIITK